MAGSYAGVQLIGLNKFYRSVKKAGHDLNDFKPEMRRTSSILGDYVRAETPKKSGRMVSTVREGTSARRASVKVGRTPEKYAYVNVLNYGKKSRYRGFIDRAVHKATPSVLQSMEDGINRVLRNNQL